MTFDPKLILVMMVASRSYREVATRLLGGDTLAETSGAAWGGFWFAVGFGLLYLWSKPIDPWDRTGW